MIDEFSTFLCFSHYSAELSYGSGKRVWSVCDICGQYRLVKFQDYRDLCPSCIKIDKKRIFTKKHKENLSKSHTNLYGKDNPMFGVKRLGKDNPNWNTNKTDEERKKERNYPEYREWRKLIYERDNYICQICKKRGGDINAHHIESYANNLELRTILLNGVTLCKKCHDNFHHQYSYFNNTREQFIEFMGSN